MKNKLKFMCLLLTTGFCLKAQNLLIVEKQTGEQTDFSVSSVDRITFKNGIIKIKERDQTERESFLHEIKYLRFIPETSNGVDNPERSTGSFLFYPNPVSDMLYIRFYSEKSGYYHVEIVDLFGKVLLQNKVTVNSGTNQISLNTDQLTEGTYICILRGDRTLSKFYLIKN